MPPVVPDCVKICFPQKTNLLFGSNHELTLSEVKKNCVHVRVYAYMCTYTQTCAHLRRIYTRKYEYICANTHICIRVQGFTLPPRWYGSRMVPPHTIDQKCPKYKRILNEQHTFFEAVGNLEIGGRIDRSTDFGSIASESIDRSRSIDPDRSIPIDRSMGPSKPKPVAPGIPRSVCFCV